MLTLTKIKGPFTYGASTRTVFKMSRPLSDRYPNSGTVMKIEHEGESAYWLPAWESGEVKCFSPICAADMAEILAAERLT